MFFQILSRIFGSFLFRGYLDDSESIVYVAHKHFWTHYRPVLKRLFFGLLIPACLWFLFPFSQYLMWAWMIVGLLCFVYALMDWYFDALLITNLSLLIVKWDGFFSNSSSRIEYTTIDGVSWSKNGIAQTILGYGNVEVTKIGNGEPFILCDASKPKEIERQILKQQNAVVQENALKNSENLKQLLVNMIQSDRLKH